MEIEEEYALVIKFLEQRGYEFEKDKDGFWFEEYMTDHKWKWVFELMEDYAKAYHVVKSLDT